MKLSFLLFCTAFFCGCGPAFEYVRITGTDECTGEKLFVESFFEENGKLWNLGLRLFSENPAAPGNAGNGGKIAQPSIEIELFSSWGYEEACGDIPVSKTFFAPAADPLDGRVNTSLAACLEGGETLMPAESIAPPFAALRVDGLALGDIAYPLVRNSCISIRAVGAIGGKQPNKTLQEKIKYIEETIKAADKPLIRALPVLFWVAAGGDLMLEKKGTELLIKEGPEAVFGKTAPMLASSDLALVNLEGVLSSLGNKAEKSFAFRLVPELAGALKDAGIDAVLHANNHAFDFGKEAFLDSLLILNRAGIGATGAGINDDAASEPFVFEQGAYIAKVFGLASFPREWNGWDGVVAAAGPGQPGMLHARRGGVEKLKPKFAKNKSGQLNIVLFHGGTEWYMEPDSFTRGIYTELIEAGADLVIGSHPHVVQGFEWVLGKPVFWSLGNYAFTGRDNTLGIEEGLFIQLGFLGDKLLYFEPFALNLSHTKTDIAPDKELEVFYAMSKELREKQLKSGKTDHQTRRFLERKQFLYDLLH
ncbi:MAG: CapA family protein [Treponema sp.]|jgi:poly-gamma-glutamate synthesis protein (capsule biosynthesis protein)|nr:CapA family protein [Treponema sp.]